MARYSFLYILAITATILVSWEGAVANTCECEQHNADASASGGCSVTEDKNSCSIEFYRFDRASVMAAVKLLGQSTGREFKFSHSRPKRLNWGDANFVKNQLPVIFMLTLKNFGDKVGGITVRKMVNAIEGRAKKIAIVIQETGCFELKYGRFTSMYKARWSKTPTGRCK